ncbi:hypothetical protein [Nocardioides sp. WS12]|uniref:hypothetical protein n=1 Tax=Nocardioides sp. WS12 TaxID=2486272 RepID=UPI0015F86F50|nr:hypothetical protein [Nocardioides sp. WS12]
MSTDDVNDSIERPREDRKPDARPSGWHAVNTGHLVMGTAFVGLVIVWALLTSDTVQFDNARWILPLPWLAAGALGLLATVLRGRRQHDTPAWVEHVANYGNIGHHGHHGDKHGWRHGGGPAHMKGWLHGSSDDKDRQD